MGRLADWTSGTIDRCLDIMFPAAEFDLSYEWYRGTNDYRNYTHKSKY